MALPPILFIPVCNDPVMRLRLRHYMPLANAGGALVLGVLIKRATYIMLFFPHAGLPFTEKSPSFDQNIARSM